MTVSTSSFDIGACSHPGRKRMENQDNYMRAEKWFNRKDLRDAYGRLYIVADGVGGNVAGADASAIVVNQVMEHFYHDPQAPTRAAQRLQYAIECANKDVHDQATSRQCNMASTVVAALIEDQRLTIANVGDSSALLFRRGAKPKKLTIDHLSTDQDGSPALFQAMGDPEVSVTITPEQFRPGDIVVLCTDGLTDLVLPQEIGEIVTRMNAYDATQKLVQLANERGGHDNITALVVRHGRFQQSRLHVAWPKQTLGIFLVLGFVLIASILSILAWFQFSDPDIQPVQHSPTSVPVIGIFPSSTTFSSLPTATLDPTTPTSTPQPPTNTPPPTKPSTPIRTRTANSPLPVTTSTTSVTEPSVTPEPSPTAPAEETPTATLTTLTGTPLPAFLRFSAKVELTFTGTSSSGQQESCVIGKVINRTGQGLKGAILYANNGISDSPQVTTDLRGGYSICGLGDSNWSIVLTFVPQIDDPSQSILQNDVTGVVYVNGSAEQQAVVNFLER